MNCMSFLNGYKRKAIIFHFSIAFLFIKYWKLTEADSFDKMFKVLPPTLTHLGLVDSSNSKFSTLPFLTIGVFG